MAARDDAADNCRLNATQSTEAATNKKPGFRRGLIFYQAADLWHSGGSATISIQ
jgi:hypothetical protein